MANCIQIHMQTKAKFLRNLVLNCEELVQQIISIEVYNNEQLSYEQLSENRQV